MSILIKGMEMPKNCDECFFVGRGFPDWCSLPQIQKDEDEIDDTNNRPDWCPLEEVQETHDKRTKTHTCDLIERQAAIDAHYEYCNKHPDAGFPVWSLKILEDLPSAQPEWNNHTVACMLAELFDDTCACNYNGIDEWLPKKCELLDSCPNPVGVACWEQFLKHRAERRTDDLQ